MEAIRRVLTVRDVWLVALCQLLFWGGWFGVIGDVPTYFVTVQGMTPTAAGVMTSIILWAYM
ncbi:MAG: hypothetical protein HY347_05175 [candidate division NC10 bacterium]|nr:hypothetical protein [candidate division NC10 bacterium]